MAVEKTCRAFLEGKRKKEGNTESTGTDLILFGNVIAQWRNGFELWVTNKGWFTNTTKDRLNKIGCRVQQVKGEWYLNGKKWNGNWVNVNDFINQEPEKQKSSIFA